MMTMADHDRLLVMTTLPDLQAAGAIARTLVEQRLAACVSIQSPCRSVYRWNGGIEQAEEIPLLIKTTARRYPALEAALRAMHPYDLPEIVAIGVADGLPAYLQWIDAGTMEDDGDTIADDQ
jgi:periplasmic divalent cation tolerance protein